MTDTDTDNRTESGSIWKGFGFSCLLALIVGVRGGAFEALILWPAFGFVTVTLGPDAVFLVANLLCLSGIPMKPQTGRGMIIGFIAVIITAVVSFAVFFEMAPNFVVDLYNAERPV